MSERERIAWLWLWPAGVVVGLGAEYFSVHAHVPESHVLDLAVGWAYIAAGLIAWRRRPDSRIGLLMLAVGFTWFIGNFASADVPALFSVAYAFQGFNIVILAHAVLTYPEGRLHDAYERTLVVALYTYELVHGVLVALTFDPRSYYHCAPGECITGGLAAFPSADAYDFMEGGWQFVGSVLALLFIALIARRFLQASPAARRILAPLWVAAILVALVAGAGAVGDFETLKKVVMLLIPAVLLFGLLRTRMAQGSVGQLVRAIDGPLLPGELRDELAKALGEPELELAFALPSGTYVDEAGHEVALPASGGSRVSTEIGMAGRPIAALIHDPSLLERPELLESVSAAARLALENERLQAEVRAQLEEVRESRARIVAAGDAERRRVERDLHDGAQQRLVTLALALSMAEERANKGADPTLAEILREASTEMSLAIEELRSLARGIHPTILTEAGLGPALDSLAERGAIPITVTGRPECRLPEPVEAAAYYVAAEGVTNAVRHSGASAIELSAVRENGHLRVRVSDDGVGGADPTKGTGLDGLRDRLAVLDGELSVETSGSRGTTILAEIPCE